MNEDISAMTLTEKANAAFREAAVKVIERARQTGTPVIVWENGRIVEKSVEEFDRASSAPSVGSISSKSASPLRKADRSSGDAT
jgi:hypothetical protein